MIPVLLLLLVDVLAYLWFRIAYQPWFTRRRTAYWTFQRPTWRSGKSSSKASSSSSSPVLGRSTALPDSTPVIQRAPATDETEAPKPPRRNRSWIHARARSVGVDGPLFGFEQMRSPSPELAPLPSDDEGSDEPDNVSGHTSEEWARIEKNGD